MNEVIVKSIKGEPCTASLSGKVLHLDRTTQNLRAIVFSSDPAKKVNLPNPVIVVWADDEIMKIECKSHKLFPEIIKTWGNISQLIHRKADFIETAHINSGMSFDRFMSVVQ